MFRVASRLLAAAAQENAGRLKGYKANLVLFPRNSKKPKSGEATADERSAAVQLEGKVLMPLPRTKPELEAVEITEEMQVRAQMPSGPSAARPGTCWAWRAGIHIVGPWYTRSSLLVGAAPRWAE